MRFSYYGLNRTLCDVLEEMRQLDKSRNYSALRGLIEEAQSMGNRMEAGLHDLRDFANIQEELKKGRQELKRLDKEIEEKENESKIEK